MQIACGLTARRGLHGVVARLGEYSYSEQRYGVHHPSGRWLLLGHGDFEPLTDEEAEAEQVARAAALAADPRSVFASYARIKLASPVSRISEDDDERWRVRCYSCQFSCIDDELPEGQDLQIDDESVPPVYYCQTCWARVDQWEGDLKVHTQRLTPSQLRRR